MTYTDHRHAVHIFKGRDDQWYFHVRGRNGQPVCTSEGYVSKSNALEGIRTMYRLLSVPRQTARSAWNSTDDRTEYVGSYGRLD